MDISANSQYDKKISDPRLAEIKKKCLECGTMMVATGTMYHSRLTSDWFIEYWCTDDQEMFYIWNPEYEALTAEIAAQ